MTRGQRIVAARLLRSLATIEKLSALGQDDDVRRFLAVVDPQQCKELAFALDEETLAQDGGLVVYPFEIKPESLRV